MVNQEWLTIAEACEFLKVSRRTLYTYLQSGALPYYQAAGSGHRRIKVDDLDGLMISPNPQHTGHRADTDSCSGRLTQELEELRAELSRTQGEKEELKLELEQIRPLTVWAGHPCAICSLPLLGLVTPEKAQELLKDYAHKECLQERKQDRASYLNWGFVGKELHEAD